MALNVKKTKQYFEENNIVALKADKDVNPAVDDLLRELGNSGTAIPYYAIFPADGSDPIHFGGNYIFSSEVIEKLEKVRPVDVAMDEELNADVNNVSMFKQENAESSSR